MKLKIEKGIPIPDGGGTTRSGIMQQLQSMKPGDSFMWPGKSRSNVHLYAKMANVKIITRATGGGKYRVWRLE